MFDAMRLVEEVNSQVLPEIHGGLQSLSMSEINGDHLSNGFSFERKMKKLLRSVYTKTDHIDRAPQNFIGSWPADYCLMWGEGEKKGSMFFYRKGKLVGEIDTLVHYHSGDYVVPIAFDFKLSGRFSAEFESKLPRITDFLSKFYAAPICVCRVEPSPNMRNVGIMTDPRNPAYSTMVIPVKAKRPSYIQ